jgi:hypothetical protein
MKAARPGRGTPGSKQRPSMSPPLSIPTMRPRAGFRGMSGRASILSWGFTLVRWIKVSIGGGAVDSPMAAVLSRPLARSRVRLPPSPRFILRPEPRQPTRCARREDSTVKKTQEILLSCTTKRPDRLFANLRQRRSWASSSGSAIGARQGIRRGLHFGKRSPYPELSSLAHRRRARAVRTPGAQALPEPRRWPPRSGQHTMPS